MSSDGEPTALSDPEGYLASFKFSRRTVCKKTGLPVSYADFGAPDGVPLLWLMPSGCSRWLAAGQDPLAKSYGVRIIAIDRPGVGATPSVPLEERIKISCDLIVSVIEQLGIKLAHIFASSAGIYYALHLLIHRPEAFLTGLSPPPRLYLIAPWSPLLPISHPDYYNSGLAWIPTPLIETQHITLPHLMNVVRGAYTAWSSGSKAFWTGMSSAKSLLAGDGPHARDDEVGNVAPLELADNGEGLPVPSADTGPDGRLWGRFPCCVGCTTTSYFHAENFEGVGQEHLQCLDRGRVRTGHEWFQAHLASLAQHLRAAQCAESGKEIPCRLNVQLWWGWQDEMVPRKGQLWFNKTIQAFPNEIKVDIHDVPDGDHTNLLGRVEGVHRLYGMVSFVGQRTGDRDVE